MSSASSAAKKKLNILMVNYAYGSPYMSGIRARRLIRGLLARQHKVTVLCSDVGNPHGPLLDGLNVCVAKAPDLSLAYRKCRSLLRGRQQAMREAWDRPNARFTAWANRWLMIPDKFLPWYISAVDRGLESHKQEAYDLVFATQPNRTNLLVGARISARLNIPCVLEYRDLWNGSPYVEFQSPTAIHRKLQIWLERKCLHNASHCITLASGITRVLRELHAGQKMPLFSQHYNFYDAEEFPMPVSGEWPAGPFTLAYVGSMYSSRKPDLILEGIQRFVLENKIEPGQWVFHWIGSSFGSGELSVALSRLGIADYVRRTGITPHKQALAYLQQSSFSLVIQSPDDDIHIPSKIFEAMGARVPCIYVAHPCEAVDIVTEAGAGLVAAPDPRSISQMLKAAWNHHKSGSAWRFNEEVRLRYDAHTAVDKLLETFYSVL